MKLYAVRVFVRDWEAACEFYEHVLGLPARYRDAELGWAEFDLGGPCFGVERVATGDAEGEALVGRFLGVSLQVDDLQATYRRLGERGVRFRGPPQAQPWGGTLAAFDDPDGNTLTLLGPLPT